MIDKLTEQDLATLISHEADYCISIYMPAHRISNGTGEDRIRLKNLLNQAEQQLVETELDHSAVRTILEPGSELLADDRFWENQEDGLAVFLSDADIAGNKARILRLPIEFEELASVDHRFHVKPLLPLFNNRFQFYVLALSRNAVHLYSGDQYGLLEMEVEELPVDMAEALWMDDPERNLQFHTETGGSTDAGTRRAQFHGHAPDEDREKTDLLRYCRVVNEAVVAATKNDQAPLVLAAVKELYPIYAEANNYPHLRESMITGNPDRLTQAEIHARAKDIFESDMAKQRSNAIEHYQDLSNTDRSVKGVHDVVTAAFQARVDTLFVATDAHQWGTISLSTGEIELANEAGPDKTDLLDFAVASTISNGGTVLALDQEQMPEPNSPIAAILRF